MRYQARAKEDIEKIYEKFGFDNFIWADVKDLVRNSAQFFKYSGLLNIVGYDKEFKCNIYQIKSECFNDESPYKLKKIPLYPRRAYTGTGGLKNE